RVPARALAGHGRAGAGAAGRAHDRRPRSRWGQVLRDSVDRGAIEASGRDALVSDGGGRRLSALLSAASPAARLRDSRGRRPAGTSRSGPPPDHENDRRDPEPAPDDELQPSDGPVNALRGADLAVVSTGHDARLSQRQPVLPTVAFVAICLIWGTTFLAIRVAIETIPTLYLTGLRFTAAGLILLVIAALRGQAMPRRASQVWPVAVTGLLLFAVANGAVVWAEHYISSGLAALLAATVPLWMALLERFGSRGERLSTGRIAGLIAGFCGVAVVVSPALVAPKAELGLI